MIEAEMALHYQLHGGYAFEMCIFNRDVCLRFNRADLAAIWHIASFITNPSLTAASRDSVLQWAHVPMGGGLARKLIARARQLANLQTLSLLTCIFSLPPHLGGVLYSQTDFESLQHTQLRSRPPKLSEPTPGVTISIAAEAALGHPVFANDFVATRSFSNVVDALRFEQTIHDGWRIQYSDWLYAIGNLTRRNEVLKFVSRRSLPADLPVHCPQAGGLLVAGVVAPSASAEVAYVVSNQVMTVPESIFRASFSVVAPSPPLMLVVTDSEVHHQSSARTSLLCSVCHCAVHGLSTFCHSCSHGGHAQHVLTWFASESHCPTGCGCNCVELMSFT
jgi:hypothetical protein